MASGTADLQRDLGGAIMQSIFGALLTAGYAAAAATAIAGAPNNAQITDSVQNELTKSFAGRGVRRRAVPAVRDADHGRGAGSRSSRATSGRTRPASSRSLLGAVLVFFLFPRKDDEQRLLLAYQAEDTEQLERRTLAHV